MRGAFFLFLFFLLVFRVLSWRSLGYFPGSPSGVCVCVRVWLVDLVPGRGQTQPGVSVGESPTSLWPLLSEIRVFVLVAGGVVRFGRNWRDFDLHYRYVTVSRGGV